MIYTTIAEKLKLSPDFVRKVGHSAHHRYKTYSIPKRSGGLRRIDHPARELKVIQRWLTRNIFSWLPVHDAAVGYRTGLGIREAAERHLGRKYYLRVDFVDFFPSIRVPDIEQVLRDVWPSLEPRLPEADIARVVDFVVRDGGLTIGAPSSPCLSNAVMFELDDAISVCCGRREIVYCRYADDMFFSTDTPHQLSDFLLELQEIITLTDRPRLQIHEDKTWFSSKKHLVKLLGLVLTPQGNVSIGRSRKREIKSRVFENIHCADGVHYDSELAGWLSFIYSVEPSFIESLRAKYGAHNVGTIWHGA
jgi:retron-type reverse transcriptase